MHQATGNALSRCLQQEASAIAAASQRLDPGQVEAALALLTSCADRRGKLVVSGVGNSGIVARKIAATFSSLGLTAVFLHPGDALHGDMGIVAADDVVLLLSNCGVTEDLLAILSHLRRRGTARIALVCRLNSSLALQQRCPLPEGIRRWGWRPRAWARGCVPSNPQRGLQGRTTLKVLQQWKAVGSPQQLSKELDK